MKHCALSILLTAASLPMLAGCISSAAPPQAASTPSHTPPTAQEPSTMSDANQQHTRSVAPLPASALTPEQVLTKTLELLQQGRPVRELSLEFLNNYYEGGRGRARYNPNGRDANFVARISQSWAYRVRRYRMFGENQPEQLDVSFFPYPVGTRRVLSEMCVIDIEELKTRLHALGFTSWHVYLSEGQFFSVDFWNDEFSIQATVWTDFKEPVRRFCVDELTII